MSVHGKRDLRPALGDAAALGDVIGVTGNSSRRQWIGLAGFYSRAVWVLLLSGIIFVTNSSGQTSARSAATPAVQPPHVILFFGDSITAGYGLADPASEAFPGLIQQRLQTQDNKNFIVVNAGVSGDTSAGGVRRIDWLLRQRSVEIFVLELGANDGLRGLPLEETRRNLQTIIDKVKAKDPAVRVVIAGMQLPPSFGADYTQRFQAIFADLAKTNDATLIPFLLQGVGGLVEFNQDDGIHPNAAGHRILAETTWQALLPLLTK